jgi:hypothetical protein
MSGYENRTLSLPAGTGGVVKGKAVKLSSSTLVLCSASDDAAIGIAEFDAAAGEMASAVVAGEAEVLCDAALTVGGKVAFNADAEVLDDAGTTDDVVLGIALEAGGANEYARVLLATIKPVNA